MNVRVDFSFRRLSLQLILAYLVLSLSACTQRSALRDKERAHYENLESELLNKQRVEDQRLRNEYRIEHNIQPSDSEKLSVTKQNTNNDVSFANDKMSEASESASAKTIPDITTPIVTQIVVGQPVTNDQARSWARQYYPSPFDGTPLCVIASNPVVVPNGELDTRVSIVISNDTVFVRTDATFDTAALDTGFQIDAGFPIPFDYYLNELTAVIDKNYHSVLSSMNSGLTLSVSFAYIENAECTAN